MMAVTNEQINAWLAANSGASDKQIRSAMDQYGVNTQQMAQATGLGLGEVQRRYDAAGAPQVQAPKQPSNPFGNPFAFSQQNPYLDQMSQAVTTQVNDNLNRNILPQIASGAMAAGGFGGSRQGVVEANALKDANQGLANSLTSMRYGDYNNQMNRQLQKYQGDQGFYTAQRGLDLQQTQLGANLFQQGNTGMLGQGQGVYNLGLTTQQAPWQVMGNFSGVSQPYTGFGTTTGTQTGSAGAGFLGGALGGSQLYNIYSKA